MLTIPVDNISLLTNTSIESIDGVGVTLKKRLNQLKIENVLDILFHFPLRYENRTLTKDINKVIDKECCNVIGTVLEVNTINHAHRMLIVTIKDHTGTLTLRFFRYSAMILSLFKVGAIFRCYGQISYTQYGVEIIHPEFTRLNSINDKKGQSDLLTPIYPSTNGLKQYTLIAVTTQALAMLNALPKNGAELLPDEFNSLGYTFTEALMKIHRPTIYDPISELESFKHPAQLRLIKEELLAYHLSVIMLRDNIKENLARPLKNKTTLSNEFIKSLPYTPTKAQARVIMDIRKDLLLEHPMMRLVQGDVGSGKTLVAAIAALTVIGNKYQVVLMAPTEILAEQHTNNFITWFKPLGINVGCLKSKMKAAERKRILHELATGELDMVIGTQALFQEKVKYKKLALVIIDEQHRFGVHQRLALRNKGVDDVDTYSPHQLVMTATPIPRTLAMMSYADLDTSIIDELPPGRTPISTVALPDYRRKAVIERIRHVCLTENRQVYWVCTLIEESDQLSCQAAEEMFTHLQRELSELTIGLIHGRMTNKEKENIMTTFKKGDIQLLVATTVIEVGVDVPNASLMIIENPERLGLAQMHQLRGRVGRGKIASHCLLLYGTPLSPVAAERLSILREINDGFVIAEKDLILRGAGEILGTKQTGVVEFKIADLVRDTEMVTLINKQSEIMREKHREQIPLLINRWLPNKKDYYNA